MNAIGVESGARSRRQKRVLDAARTGGLCLLGVLSLTALAAQQSTRAVLLRMKFTPGAKATYRLTLEFTGTVRTPAGSPQSLQMKMTREIQAQVTRRLPNDSGEETLTTQSQQITLNGQPSYNTPEAPPVTVTYDARGRGRTGGSATLAGMPFAGTMGEPLGLMLLTGGGAYLPAQAVRPGNRWTETARLPGTSGLSTATIRSTFLRYETIEHQRAAHIRSVVSLPIHSLLDATLNAVPQANQAVTAASGSARITFEKSFAIAEGRTARTTGSGTITITTQHVRADRAVGQSAAGASMTSQMDLKISLRMEPVVRSEPKGRRGIIDPDRLERPPGQER